MTGLRFLSSIPFLLGATTFALAQAHPIRETPVTLTPTIVVAGAPELIRVIAPDAVSVDGECLGRKIMFFHSRESHDWIALAGIDVEAATGPSALKITAHRADGKTLDLTRSIDIHPAHYRTGVLSVPPKFVEPNQDEVKEAEADSKIKAQVFASSAADPLWHGNFRAPVLAPPTDSFGTRRTFNGKLASIHKGMDFRAPVGTVVRAGNSGVVVLARPLYFEGNCVIIDHGQGLYSISMHFSRIDVHEGQQVSTGDPLGLSGATGRVTGPHLHWAIRWQGASLDPAKLLRLNLSSVR
ncbi:MAG TPA: M23 family metallopeptidase [Terracidiphilus sp.]|jgi:murein DD-endopeptidase MepM/ murein hydrolase activator NlpD|nr:M23 family metallopeptidase [Terracidiphilus sp.]